MEPNDAWDAAQAVDAPITLRGSLVPGDTDCFSLTVPEAGAVRATLSQPGADVCTVDGVLELLDDQGVRVVSGLPSGPSGCPALDPDTNTFARYLTAGTYAVCLATAFEGSIPVYALTLAVADSCSELPALPPDPTQDLEADGIADACDADDDNDGVADAEDNCPTVPNGDGAAGWDTNDQGYVRQWMVLGPFSGTAAKKGCEPTAASLAGPDDASTNQELGDEVGDLNWFASWSWPAETAVVRFTDWFSSTEAPREAYAAVWVNSETAREAELAIGADDGFRVWMNRAEIGTHTGCQGVYVDAYRYPVSLAAGYNRLLVKVYDGGGGWGLVARFYEPDGKTPMTGLQTSLVAGPWVDDQGDADGDGLGDVCDLTP